MTGAALFPTASIPAGSVTLRHTGRRLSRMRFICSGWERARSATGWFFSASLGHRMEGSREERAFELAKNEYLAWLEHKADRYTTVYGYMGLGDRYEQHLL